MPYVIGIDAGATKTVCHLADETGRLVAATRGPGANLQAAGELAVEKVLHEVMDAAIADRHVTPDVICLGIAGVDRREDIATIQAVMRRIGARARTLVVNDALVALAAAVQDAPGVVIVAGTGSIAYGRNAQEEAARAGGWGYVIGDEGGGYWIGRQALRTVVRSADGRERSTRLTPLVLAHFDVDQPQDLVHAVYDRTRGPADMAALAQLVQQAHDEGDPAASAILERAARELLISARAVVARLDLQGTAFPFVLAGGIFHAVPWLEAELTRRLAELAPRATVRRLEVEPAAGAVYLALAELRGRARLPVYKPPFDSRAGRPERSRGTA